jgi:hypothetical protein
MIDSMNTTRDRPGAAEVWAVIREYMQSMGVEAPDGLETLKYVGKKPFDKTEGE